MFYRFCYYLVLCFCAITWASSMVNADYRRGAEQPDWVQSYQFDSPESVDTRTYRSDIEYLLVDNQVMVDTNGEVEFTHYAFKILSFAGVQNNSSIEMVFNPLYQTLDIHCIEIHRDGETIDCIPKSRFEELQQEKNLDRKLFDGRLSVVVFLSDVRSGDIVEYSYSVAGRNPVVGDHYCGAFKTAWRIPIKDYYFRLNWNRSDQLDYRVYDIAGELQIQEQSIGQSYSLHISDQPAIETEDGIPSWAPTGGWFEFSNYRQWKELVDWAVPLYGEAMKDHSLVDSFVSQWQKREYPDQLSLAIAVLRYVQDEIRYLGIEMGDHSLVPHSPDSVLKQRFGDCKDKSLLLVTTLNRLGIEAYPALVNTFQKHMIETFLPSVSTFNHVIVKMIIDDITYWVDPTRSYQRGKIDGFQNPDYRRALVLKAGNEELESFKRDNPIQPQFVVREKFIFTPGSSDVLLEVKTLYKGQRADALRYDLACESVKERERSYLNFYNNVYPGIRAQRPIEITDNEDLNEIVHYERYIIPEFYLSLENEYTAWAITSKLTEPDYQSRKYPYLIPNPLYEMHIIEISMERIPTMQPSKLHIQNEMYEFKYTSRKNRSSLIMIFTYSTFTDHIGVENFDTYLKDIGRMNAVCSFVPQVRGVFVYKSVFNLLLVIFILIPGAIIVIMKMVSARPQTGKESMIGMTGVVSRQVSDTGGTIFVHGEIWQARTVDSSTVPEGESVVVVAMNGLTLQVKPKA